MKTRIITVLLLCALLLTGCAPKESFSPSSSPSPSGEKNLETEPRTIGETPSIGMLRLKDFTNNFYESCDSVIAADFDGDRIADSITVEVFFSGHSQIKKMTIELSTASEPYIIENYDASLLKYDKFYDSTNKRSVLVLTFDMHANGGIGACEILLVTVQDGKIQADNVEERLDKKQLYPTVAWTENRTAAITNKYGELIAEVPVELTGENGFLYIAEDDYKTARGDIDWMHNSEIVNYQLQERLMIYQYVYGTSHSVGVAIILSLVDISGEVYTIDKQWVIPYN